MSLLQTKSIISSKITHQFQKTSNFKTTSKETNRRKCRMTSAGTIFSSGLIHTRCNGEDLEYEISWGRHRVQSATWETGKPHAAGTTDNRELLVGIFSPTCSHSRSAPNSHKQPTATGLQEWNESLQVYINTLSRCQFKFGSWEI